MKKLVALSFSLMIMVVAFISSCTSCQKEKEVVVTEKVAPPPPAPKPIALEKFLAESIAKVKSDEPVIVKIPSNVLSSEDEIVIGLFKREWTVAAIDPVLEKYPLTVVQKYPDGSQNLVYFYEDLPLFYDDEILTVIDPAPKYIAVVGDEFYILDSSGKEWKTRK